MPSNTSKLRWGVEQRLEFIEYKLFWEGSVNRGDIIESFGVSMPQASKDLSHYQEIAPKNLTYDKSAKRYVPSGNFKPRLLSPNAEDYLANLEKRTGASPDLLTEMARPKAAALPRLGREIDPAILRVLAAGARDGLVVSTHYQSMNPDQPEPTWRDLSPHAFGNDGTRWHVRAYCHRDDQFKDFLISRFLSVRPKQASTIDPMYDTKWMTTFEVILTPNPALSPDQRSVISTDYGMKNDQLTVSVRESFLFYFLRRYRLDLSDLSADPREAPLVIVNRKEFDAALNAPAV